jgi:micrococcal nuclease
MAVGVFTLKPGTRVDQAQVIRVVDGDTLKVKYQGRPERLRLIGVDTPESAPNAKARRDSRRSKTKLNTVVLMGQQAKHFLAQLVSPGDVLKLEFDVQETDKYGRLLVYAYLADGRMLNEVLVREGYAQVMTIPPNVKYQTRFTTAYEQARAARAGLWKEGE